MKENRQEMDAFDFFEIQQNRDWGPKDPPILPVLVGKLTDEGVTSINIKGRFCKLEPQRCRLPGQKQGKKQQSRSYPNLQP